MIRDDEIILIYCFQKVQKFKLVLVVQTEI